MRMKREGIAVLFVCLLGVAPGVNAGRPEPPLPGNDDLELTRADLANMMAATRGSGTALRSPVSRKVETIEDQLTTVRDALAAQLKAQAQLITGLCGAGADFSFCPHRDQKFVFVTSLEYYGSMAGVVGADIRCNIRSVAANLPGFYKAWISDSAATAPNVTFTHSSVPYVLPGGTPVADNWNDLTDGQLDHPINQDEFGNAVPDLPVIAAWTSTNSHGEHIQPYTTDGEPISQDCDNWTSAEPLDASSPVLGVYGLVNESGSAWSFGSSGGLGVFQTGPGITSCDSQLRLYCVQQ